MNITESFQQVPEQLRVSIQRQWQSFVDTGVDSSLIPEEIIDTLPKVWACSEFAMLTCVQFPGLFMELASSGDLTTTYDWEHYNQSIITEFKQGDEAALNKHLRLFRRREMLRIIWRDIAGWADLKETTADLS